MSFVGLPSLAPGSAILGAGLDYRPADEKLFERRMHGTDTDLAHTVIIIIVSALLFVTVIALFDLIKAFITYYYLAGESEDKELKYKDYEKKRIRKSAGDSLRSSAYFAALCIVITIILVPLLLSRIKKQ